MSEEKRMVSDTGFEVVHAIRLGDSEVLVAENMKEKYGEQYLVANFTDNGIVGEYSSCVVGDYMEIMKEFTERLNIQIDKINDRFGKADYQAEPFTAEHCYPNDYKQSIESHIVAIKASALLPEYRRGDVQLIYVTGGNGAKANARGSAVFCYHLNNGKHTRFERQDVLGQVKPECIPDWAKQRLADIQKNIAAEKKAASREER